MIDLKRVKRWQLAVVIVATGILFLGLIDLIMRNFVGIELSYEAVTILSVVWIFICIVIFVKLTTYQISKREK